MSEEERFRCTIRWPAGTPPNVRECTAVWPRHRRPLDGVIDQRQHLQPPDGGFRKTQTIKTGETMSHPIYKCTCNNRTIKVWKAYFRHHASYRSHTHTWRCVARCVWPFVTHLLETMQWNVFDCQSHIYLTLLHAVQCVWLSVTHLLDTMPYNVFGCRPRSYLTLCRILYLVCVKHFTWHCAMKCLPVTQRRPFRRTDVDVTCLFHILPYIGHDWQIYVSFCGIYVNLEKWLDNTRNVHQQMKTDPLWALSAVKLSPMAILCRKWFVGQPDAYDKCVYFCQEHPERMRELLMTRTK